MKNRTKKNRPSKQTKPQYTDADYKNNNGMLTQVWGPPLWHFLHTMSFNYPVKPTTAQKKQYKDHVLSFQYVLPCGKCRDNLAQNFKELPLTDARLKSRESFSRYIYDLHEHINKMLGKPSGLTYEQVRDRYESFRARCAGVGELGCSMPMYSTTKRCIMRIVDADTEQHESLTIDHS